MGSKNKDEFFFFGNVEQLSLRDVRVQMSGRLMEILVWNSWKKL